MITRRIIYFVATSLDGFVARTDGNVDWLFHDQDYGFTEFFENVETVVQGRKTYEQVLTFGDYPYREKQNFVFSRTLTSCEHGEIVAEPVAEFTARLQKQTGNDIWLVGGGELAASFLSEGLVDDVIVFVHPVLLGNGLRLSPGLTHDVSLKLVETESFDSGLVKLRYAIADEAE
jgi:dihydrofolate reductase